MGSVILLSNTPCIMAITTNPFILVILALSVTPLSPASTLVTAYVGAPRFCTSSLHKVYLLRLHLDESGEPHKISRGGDNLGGEALLRQLLPDVEVGGVLLQRVVRDDVEVVDVLVVGVGGAQHRGCVARVEDCVRVAARRDGLGEHAGVWDYEVLGQRAGQRVELTVCDFTREGH